MAMPLLRMPSLKLLEIVPELLTVPELKTIPLPAVEVTVAPVFTLMVLPTSVLVP
jgi:hypothetical protein